MLGTVLHRTTKELREAVNIDAYDAVAWIKNPNLSGVLSVSPDYWKISGDTVSEMSQTEKDAVDANLLPVEKGRAAVRCAADVTAYLGSRYPEPAQRSLMALQEDARNRVTPLLNRAAYIQAVVDWVKTVLDYYKDKRAEIDGAATRTALAAVTWDFTTFTASDPLRTVPGAMAIQD
jgi:hypothetical protein